MHFRIQGLPAEQFDALFSLADGELAARRARRSVVPPGASYPCRVSLTDAQQGEEVVLVYYEHHAVDSPYRAGFAIYVRPGEQTFDQVDVVPEQLRRRTLAVRGYDAQAMLVACEILSGQELEGCIGHMLTDQAVQYLHVFYAKPGCYAARVERA